MDLDIGVGQAQLILYGPHLMGESPLAHGQLAGAGGSQTEQSPDQIVEEALVQTVGPVSGRTRTQVDRRVPETTTRSAPAYFGQEKSLSDSGGSVDTEDANVRFGGEYRLRPKNLITASDERNFPHAITPAVT
ncbi:hypothetical protein HerbRD11066_48720 [Herbidospora sp. RD11066]